MWSYVVICVVVTRKKREVRKKYTAKMSRLTSSRVRKCQWIYLMSVDYVEINIKMLCSWETATSIQISEWAINPAKSGLRNLNAISLLQSIFFSRVLKFKIDFVIYTHFHHIRPISNEKLRNSLLSIHDCWQCHASSDPINLKNYFIEFALEIFPSISPNPSRKDLTH